MAHLVADWLLQNDWMATNKGSLRHPAAWVHGAIQFALLTLALGWVSGLVLAVVHILVDTRSPQRMWAKWFGQTMTGALGRHVQIWGDQVIHIATLALWIWLMPHLGL